MKLCKLIIVDYQQFKNFELDFTYPVNHEKAGEPLEKICLIGRNGTGKTTLLRIIFQFLSSNRAYNESAVVFVKYKICGESFYYTYKKRQGGLILKEEIETIPGWIDVVYNLINQGSIGKKWDEIIQKYSYRNNEILQLFKFENNANDLVIYCPSETDHSILNQVSDVPQTQLSEALKFFKTFPFQNIVSTDKIKEFWNLLIFQVKKRDNDYRDFENQEENQDKTLKVVKQEFEKANPIILEKIGKLWNRILGKAGLEFDVANASNPIQVNENLKAYIKLSSTGEAIPYNKLSSGISNFIFRVGHIYSLYFNRKIDKGFLLIDEPENSLFPDFLYDLVDQYFNLTHNTQLITATHSPIIAAQFESFERIILDFNEDGSVFSKKGVTPIGDDPSDLLIKDFGVRNLLGKQGMEKWERFIELRILMKQEKNHELKNEMIKEYMEIGNNYNFSGDEVFKKNG